MRDVTTIDCGYFELPQVAAAYLLTDGDEAAFVETNTSLAVPRLLEALAARNMAPEQVRWVIITHVHLDHAGGASALMKACPNATLLAHPRAARHAIDPTRLVQSATAVYGAERFARLYGAIHPVDADRVRIMDDDSEVELGRHPLRFLHTRGHANHHMVVHDPELGGVFTGDAFGIGYPALQSDGPLVFPSTSPTDFHPEEAHRAVDRIVATGAHTAWLTHFGPHHDLPGIATMLHDLLDQHDHILQRATQLPPEDLDAFCLAEVQDLFDRLLTRHPATNTPAARDQLALDIDLNAQGLAVVARKRQRKTS